MSFNRNKVGIHSVLSEMADVRIALQHLEFQLGDYQAHLNEKVIKGNN